MAWTSGNDTASDSSQSRTFSVLVQDTKSEQPTEFTVDETVTVARFVSGSLEAKYGPCTVIVNKVRTKPGDRRLMKDLAAEKWVVVEKKRGDILPDGKATVLKVFPDHIQAALKAAVTDPDAIDEIYVHVGQETTVKDRYKGLKRLSVMLTAEEALAMTSRYVSPHHNVAKLCLPGDAPHRLAVMRLPCSSTGKPVGFTLRFSRWVKDVAQPLYKYIDEGKSILLVGKPCSGKSTVLKDLARYCSQQHTTAVIDYMGELCGCDPVPYKFVANVKRFLVADRAAQPAAVLEAIAHHGPQWLIVDELMSQEDVEAAVDAATRGVSVIATVHADSLRTVVNNKKSVELVGGRQPVILAYQERMERNASRKACNERLGSPAFDVVVELHSLSYWYAIEDVPSAVDRIHLGEDYDAHMKPI
ncbi:hypothetical protein DIPPA_27712 [Diplonema papillatum]|nr:hypothetical protein DIPPA_27712 [Diplonema papillatum]